MVNIEELNLCLLKDHFRRYVEDVQLVEGKPAASQDWMSFSKVEALAQEHGLAVRRDTNALRNILDRLVGEYLLSRKIKKMVMGESTDEPQWRVDWKGAV